MYLLRPFAPSPRSIFLLACIATLFPYFHQVGMATISQQLLQSLNESTEALGVLGMAFSLPYAAMQLPAGIVTDRFGPRACMAISLLLAAIGTYWFAFTTTLDSAILARIITGASISVIFVPTSKLLATWFAPERYARVIGYLFFLSSVGYWLPTTPMAYAASVAGWRTSFAVIAVLTALWAIVIALFVRNDKTSATGIAQPRYSKIPVKTILIEVLRNRQALLMALWYLCTSGIYMSFVGTWGGQYLMTCFNYSEEEVGWILAPAAVSIGTAPLFTYIAEKLGSRKTVFCFLSGTGILLSLPLAFQTAIPTSVFTLYFFLFSTATMGGASLLFASAKDLFPMQMTGTVTGFINMAPFIGAALFYCGASLIFSLGANNPPSFLFSLVFGLYAVGCVISFIIALTINPPEQPFESSDTARINP